MYFIPVSRLPAPEIFGAEHGAEPEALEENGNQEFNEFSQTVQLSSTKVPLGSALTVLSSLFAASCDRIVFLARLARSPHSARTGAVRGEAA